MDRLWEIFASNLSVSPVRTDRQEEAMSRINPALLTALAILLSIATPSRAEVLVGVPLTR